MTTIPLPAPLGRRLAAAVYDGLLLIGLWMVALFLDVVLRDLLGLGREWPALRAYVFLIGLGFFGWFWTHGGQTLGMRAWRLQVQTLDGRPPGWLNALGRYATMMACWGICLAPALLQLPRLSRLPYAPSATLLCLGVVALALLAWRADPQRLAPHDWLSGTRTLLLPGKTGGEPAA